MTMMVLALKATVFSGSVLFLLCLSTQSWPPSALIRVHLIFESRKCWIFWLHTSCWSIWHACFL